MNHRTLIVLACACALHTAHAQKREYMEDIRAAAEKAWKDDPSVVGAWKKHADPNVLWGYNPPAHPVYCAAVCGFLFEQTHERVYAERTAALLGSYGDLRASIPGGYAASRIEYANGFVEYANSAIVFHVVKLPSQGVRSGSNTRRQGMGFAHRQVRQRK